MDRSRTPYRRQFTQTNEKEKQSLETISCGVPQGSILGPFLFLLYVNDLKTTSNILDTIMFPDETNVFFTHQDITQLLQIVNQELENISQWFISDKLSLTNKILINPVKKKKFHFFLPKLIINNYERYQTDSTEFFWVLLDENISWKEHNKFNEKK